MRTLKKVLALSLVCAMAFTMMAGAAFGDQDKINTDLSNDIELMTALGVFKGDDKGNFNPTESVTRAQAAKMIYVLKNNGNDDGATAFTGASVYADVATGFWGDGYISYCTNSGYMGGWAENGLRVFAPNAPVTGQEMAKMLLCLVGYKADVQGYVGNGWQAKVNADALEAGIFMDYTPVVSLAAPREWTARLLANAINAYQVSYGKDGLTVGTLTYAEKTLKLKSVVGKLEKTKTVQLANAGQNPARTPATGIKSQISGVTPNVATGNVATMDFNYDASAKFLGQKVKVYYKEGNTLGLENATKVYSVMPSDSKVFNVKLSEISVTAAGVSFPGYSRTPNGSALITPYYNNVKGVAENVVNSSGVITTENRILGTEANLKGAAFNFGANINETVRISVDAAGLIDAVYYTSPTYAIVDKIDTAKQSFNVVNAADHAVKLALKDNGVVGAAAYGSATTLTFGTTEDGKKAFAQLNFIDTVEKGDVVSITPNFATGKMIYDIKEVTPVSGKVTSFGVNSTNYTMLAVDGTEYKVSGKPMNGYTFSVTPGADKTMAKDATSFYTDGKYLVFASGEKTSEVFTKNFAYVIGANDGVSGLGGSDAKIQLLLADNTIKTFNYAKNADVPSKGIKMNSTNPHSKAITDSIVKPGTGLPAVGTTPAIPPVYRVVYENVFEYVINEDGAVYLKPLLSSGSNEVEKTTGNLTYSKADQMFKDAGTRNIAKLGSDTVVFSKFTSDTETKYAAVKGSELNYNIMVAGTDATNINTDGKHVAYTKSTGLPVMIYGTVNYNTADIPSSTSSNKYAIITGNTKIAGSVDKSNYLVTADAIVNGTETQLQFKVLIDGAEQEMARLNGFRNNLITYVMKGEYADVATSPKTTTQATPADGKWTKVGVKGFNSTSIYGESFTADTTASDGTITNGAGTNNDVYFNITDKTKVMYVDATSRNIIAVTDGAMAKSSDSDLIANAIILGKTNADGSSSLDASVIVMEVNGYAVDSTNQGTGGVQVVD